MSKRNLLVMITILTIVIVFESTVVRAFFKDIILPDFALVIILFYANSKGPMEGQLSGFAAGLVEDFMSLSPLGFNCIIKTVLGYISGFTRNKIYFDPILFPVVFTAAATLLKGFLAVLVSSLFLESGEAPLVFTSRFGIEILLNSVTAPFVFAMMKLFRLYRIDDRGL